MPSFLPLTVEQQWFFQLFCSILVSVGNGAQFCFGIFSPYMKGTAFGYSQEQLNAISTVGIVLSYFSLPTGYLFDRYGPRLTLLIAGVTAFVGWFGMFLVFYDLHEPLLGTSVLVVSIFYGLSNFSASFFETGSVLSNLEGFSLHQGRVVIIQKTFMGLGSSIISQIYLGFFQQSVPIHGFFLFLAVFSLAVGLFGAFFIHLPTDETRVLGLNVKLVTTAVTPHAAPSLAGQQASLQPLIDPSPHNLSVPASPGGDDAIRRFDRPFAAGQACLALVLVFVTTVTIVEDYKTFSSGAAVATGISTVILVLAFYAMVLCAPPPVDSQKGAAGVLQNVEVATAALYDAHASQAEGTCNTSQVAGTMGCNGAVWFLNDAPLLENIRTPEMMLMWVVSFGVWGTTTLVTSNSSQIYQALDFDDYKESTNAVYVSMFGVASALGRVAVGVMQPALLARRRHVVALFPVAPLINVLALPLFFVVPPTALILPFFLSGLATGCTWGSTVLIIKSLFHHGSCGKHYNVLYTAGMLTPIVMNLALFGPIYDRHSSDQGREASHSCKGGECILVPAMVSLALNVVAVCAAYLFYLRVSGNGGIVRLGRRLDDVCKT